MAGLHKAVLKVVKYEKIREVSQYKHERPSQFLDHLTKDPLQHTNPNPETSSGELLLMTYFSQSFPDIRAKLKHLDSTDRSFSNDL